eukprot:NODE_2833_length_1110_cov_62.474081_g2597_i0.p1 GENE.NODE_2833_length_1110_cov_62.474081_g2597_i0~~NODE_2833_length_1110_cov_62.474081_g2597_i0.p1  ORF type:complete len:233 (+),score=77.62 NODE_2833_length_1110_cov_62.474081_g2597_i0:116-814(+)
MAPKKVTKILNQKGQKGNKVQVVADVKLDKKGKPIPQSNNKRGPPTQAEIRAKKKAEEEAHQAELRKLFKPVPSKEDEKKKKAAAEGTEGDKDAYAHLKEGEDYLWTAEDFEPVEVDESRLEEKLQIELEELRAKLAESGGGTPVTAETFKEWKKQKLLEQQEAEAKKRQRQLKTGHMTGRLLYEMRQEIFVDDDAGYEDYAREDEPEEKKEAEGAIDASLFDGADLDAELA